MLSFTASADTLEDRVEELEFKSALNAIQWGGSFKVMYDTASTEKTELDPTGDPVEDFKNANQFTTTPKNAVQLLRMVFNLDMNIDVTSRTSFYSRLTMSKIFNHGSRGRSFNDPNLGNLADIQSSDNFSGSNVIIERAYFNYRLTDSLTFSAGRLPTVDGPPSNWIEGRPVSGTYPKLAFSNVFDGVALTYNLNNHMPEGHSLTARALYTPFVNFGYEGVNDAPSDGARDFDGHSPSYTAMLDYSWNNSGFADSLDFILQWSRLYDWQGSVTSSGVATPNTLSLDYEILSAYLGTTNVANTGIDLSLSWLKSTIGSTGTALGALQRGWHTDKESDKNSGSGILASLRYQLPVSMLNNPYIGVEYIKGDEHYFFVDGVSHNLIGFYSTRGTGTHVYYTQQLDTSLSTTIGWMEQNHDYGLNTIHRIGKPAKFKAHKRSTVYAHMNLSF